MPPGFKKGARFTEDKEDQGQITQKTTIVSYCLMDSAAVFNLRQQSLFVGEVEVVTFSMLDSRLGGSGLRPDLVIVLCSWAGIFLLHCLSPVPFSHPIVC